VRGTGSTFSYALDVPRNNGSGRVAEAQQRSEQLVDLVLIDPNGELADVGSNQTFDATGRSTPP